MKKPNITTLENGLSIISIETAGPSTTVMTVVSAGSKYETSENNGISHFLEHMCFKGTNTQTGKDIMRYLDGLGAETNAFTTKELTGYYVKSIHKFWKKTLAIVSDIYIHSQFPADEIEKEKGVIIGEIAMYDDMPMYQVHNMFHELVFTHQPAGMTVLGPKSNIKKMTRHDFLDYHQKHYVASGTAIVVVGDVKHTDVVADVSKQFVNISDTKKHKKTKTKLTQKKPQMIVQKKETDQTHIVLGYLSEKREHKDTLIINMIGSLLGGGMSSRLFERLREDLGVGYYVNARNKTQDDTGVLEISCGIDSTRTNEVLFEIQLQIQRLISEPVTDSELKKVREHIIGGLQMNLEVSEDIAYFYGGQYVAGLGYKTPADIVKLYKQVTAKDIQRVAKKIFKNERLNCAIVGPHHTSEVAKFKRTFVLK